ncbi:MAG: tetratricopeptide repeat protein [Candidatus Kapaibacterium sp.]
MRRRSPSRFFPVEAEQLLQAGDIASATELCKYGLVYFPENISGYAVLAQAYLMLEQPERALNVLEDGYRRTGAEGLKSFCDIVRGVDESSVESEELEGELSVESEELESGVAAGLQPAPEIVEAVESNASEVEESSVESEELESEVAAGLQPAPVIAEAAESDDLIVEEPEVESDIPATSTTDDTSKPVEEEVIPEFRFVVDNIDNYVEASEESVRESREEMSEVEELSESEEDTSVDFPFFISFDSKSEMLEEITDVVPLPSEVDEVVSEEVVEESDSSVSEEEVELKGVGGEVESVVEEEREEVSTTDEAVVQESSVNAPIKTPTKVDHKGSESKPTTTESGEPIELSIRSGTRISRLRSSNLRLIPGLEFAPLRRDEPKLKIAPLVQPISSEPDVIPPESGEPSKPEKSEEMLANPPEATPPDVALPDATSAIPLISGLLPQIPSTSSAPMTPLEELARRLETARIPIVEGESTEREEIAFEPSIVSETFAGILEKQGAYQEAIKAYQMLSRLKPDRRADFEKKIEEVRWKMTNVVQGEE